MAETLPQGRRFQLGPACLPVLLILSAAGLGLAALTALQGKPLAGTPPQQDAPRAARDYAPSGQRISPCGSLRQVLAHPDVIPSHPHPLLGRQAPDFQLADIEGQTWNLRELQAGGAVVLIFYYGSQCKGCVRQLYEVHRDLPLFRELGARVVGISADPVEVTRRRFEQDGPFGFLILSDPGNKVAQAYQVFRQPQDGKTPNRLLHGTFVLDQEGTVQWINVGDAPFHRNPALLYQLARMEGRLPSAEPSPSAGKRPILRGGTLR